MKCKGKNGGEQHEIMAKSNGEAPKFCGDCGADVVADAPMIKCTACDTDLMAKARFCNECGVEQTTTVEQLDQVAGEIADFVKARVTETTALATLPDLDDVEIDDAAIENMLKAATVEDATGEPGIDAVPVVTELLKSVQADRHAFRKGATHLNAHMAAIGKDNAAILRFLAPIALTLKSVVAEVARIGNTAVGRKMPAVVPALPARADAAIEDGNLGGDDLMAKCLTATDRNPSLLGINDVSALEGYCAAGFTLKAIHEQDPGLGAKASAALASLAH